MIACFFSIYRQTKVQRIGQLMSEKVIVLLEAAKIRMLSRGV